ncbi:MAG TPA: hypothetical protein PK375_06690 [Rhodocyclaceae bacterium]|nr:hypothetical protein [Rhodocyclaceae bacterium]
MKTRHFPLTFLFFTALGTLTAVVGVAALAGWTRGTHPLLNDDMAGWALIVTAVALFLTGGFPLVLRRLAEREGA